MNKKVNNTQLDRNIKYKVNEEKYAEFLLKMKDYKDRIGSLDIYIDKHMGNVNMNSYLVHLLAKKSSIGTNTIEKVVIDEGQLEKELVSKTKELKNERVIQSAINFIQHYENANEINWNDLKNAVKQIHGSIFKGVKEANPGKFKKNINFIPEQKEFIDPSLVEEELIKLGTFVSNSQFSGIAIAAIAHAKFIEIHPFTDGNGRIGRLFANKIIQSQYDVELWIDEAMSLNMISYISSLDKFAFESDATEIVNFYIEMAIQQINRNLSIIEDITYKSKSMADKISIKQDMAQYIFTRKAVNVANFASEFDIHRNTAKSILEKAVENGYMTVVDMPKTKIYVVK